MKKVLMVIDQPGWVFHSHALQIQKRLPEYKIDIAHHRQNIAELSKNYDLVYVMDPMPMSYPPQSKTIMGLRCEFLYKEHPGGVRGLYEKGFPGRCVSIKDKCCMLHMVNKNQIKAFKDVVKDKPLLLVQHGINEEIFIKDKYPKVYNEKMVIGVSGRSSPNKGFHLVKEACNKTNCVLLSAQYGKRHIPKELMPKYYRSIDIHVCMSLTEGLSNPIMEAGSMGVAVVSTRCGAYEEMIINDVSGILINRDVSSLCSGIEKLKDVKLRENMGNHLQEEIIKNWTWKVKINDFRNMFNMYFGN